jgi:hypothetical protein
VLPELDDDFRDVTLAHVEAGAELIVIGAHALAAHGLVRAAGARLAEVDLRQLALESHRVRGLETALGDYMVDRPEHIDIGARGTTSSHPGVESRGARIVGLRS